MKDLASGRHGATVAAPERDNSSKGRYRADKTALYRTTGMVDSRNWKMEPVSAALELKVRSRFGLGWAQMRMWGEGISVRGEVGDRVKLLTIRSQLTGKFHLQHL